MCSQKPFGASTQDQEGLPDYWGIETRGAFKPNHFTHMFPPIYQEGLPDYWGIETYFKRHPHLLAYDYPTTGVLTSRCLLSPTRKHQEGLPDYWGIETRTRKLHKPNCDQEGDTGVLKLNTSTCLNLQVPKVNQEGLPDYWGIETSLVE